MDNQLYQQVFHLQQLVQRRGSPHRLLQSRLGSCRHRFSESGSSALSLHLLAHSVAHEVVQGIDDDSLVHAQAMGTVGDVGCTGNLILDFRDALYNGIDCLAALHGVSDAPERNVGLELDEVYLMVFNIFSEVFCRMVAGKAVRVVTVGQQEHLHVHLLFQQHVGSSQCRMYTRSITVVEQHDVAGESVEQSYLMDAQGCSRVCHHVLNAALVHGDDVRIALHHVNAVFLGDGFLCLIQSVELSFLMVDFAVGRIDVFLVHALGPGVQHASSECHDLSTHARPREDGTTGESVQVLILSALVARLILVYLETESGGGEIFRVVSLLHSLVKESRALWQGESQLELPDDVVTESTAAEILHSDGPSVHVVLQNVLEILRSPIVHDIHGFAFALPLLLLVGHLAFLNLDVIFLGEPAERIGIAHLLQLHQEVDGVSTLAAGKAVADATGRRNGERRMGIVMERTQADIIDAALFQRHEFRHHLFYLGGVHNTGYGRFVYHIFLSYFYDAKLILFSENTKHLGEKTYRNRMESQKETNNKVKGTSDKELSGKYSYLCSYQTTNTIK